ncbi:MAG: rane protein of unknown function [Candidatus Saccharibacteria bacterium]|nr:rane protein of unknown function [Candidatus Saccharibacteria bacterium]
MTTGTGRQQAGNTQAEKSGDMNLLDRIFITLLLIVFGGIVLHAPLTVGFETLFPHFELLIKSWKEILLGAATVLGGVVLLQKRQLAILKQPVLLLIAGYALLHLLLLVLIPGEVTSSLAGILIDLRYLLFFVLVLIAVRLYPQSRRWLLVTGLVGALVVLIFAVLQATILPPDILKFIGYSQTTIAPYLTVDQNMDFIRINSTLRGPNSLGAYAVITLTLLLTIGLKGYHQQFKRPMGIVAILGIGNIVALWASYSRSALIGAVVAVGTVLIYTFRRRITKWVWIGMIALAVVLGGIFVAARNTDFVSNVVLHEDRGEGNNVNSNDGHVSSLIDGARLMLTQPYGAGIGSTGSASLYGDQPLIIENQYLFIAHEAGWVGLALFLGIFVSVLMSLWRGRADWLAFGVFASGIGLAIIGMVLPVWADDTIGIIWWGLAAIAVGSVEIGNGRGKTRT